MLKIAFLTWAAIMTSCTQSNAANSPQPTSKVACTEEAKQCPDGSWVGRSGPRCEFICPPPLPN